MSRAVAETVYPFYDRDQDQYIQHKSVVQSKARFTGVADIINGEFQGHYAPFDTDQQGNSANGQQVIEGAIVKKYHTYSCNAYYSSSRIDSSQ